MNTPDLPSTRRHLLFGAAALGLATLTAPARLGPGRMAEPIGFADRRLPARRPDRLCGPCAAKRAAGGAGPADRHRQQGGGQRQSGLGGRDEGARRRLPAAGRQRLDDHCRACLHHAGHRRSAPADAHRRDAAIGAGAGGAGLVAGEDLCAVRRAGQIQRHGQGRQGHRLRHRRCRRAAARHHGAVARAPGQPDDEPRALQRQQPGNDRPDRRPPGRDVRRHLGDRAVHQVGPAAGRCW